MRYAVSTALCLAVVLSARAAWPQEGPAAEVERLRAKVAAL